MKRLVQGLEGREPIAIIVDDSQAVWPHDRRNLFVVERYIYFPSSKERFGLQGLSLLEIDRWALGAVQCKRAASVARAAGLAADPQSPALCDCSVTVTAACYLLGAGGSTRKLLLL